MKKRMLFPVPLILWILFPVSVHASIHPLPGEKGWRAGVAKTVITPGEPMWLAGYAFRDHPSDGKIQDLWAKALALEDAGGRQVVLVTTDLVGIPKGVSDNIRNRLEKKFHLSREQIILNASHTHSGPVLKDALFDIYPLDAGELKKIDTYSDWLEDQIVALAGNALHSLEPAQLYAQNGVARFQVNRRNNDESRLPEQTALNGPNDDAVPVIKVVNGSGNLMAIVFGYACHNTVLSGYEWSGDYAGFAQSDLEKDYPGVTALFFQGAGADQNPLPRHTLALTRQYGETLAAAVKGVLSDSMRALSPRISAAYKEVELPLSTPPSREELLKTEQASSGYQKRWADNMLQKLTKEGSLPRSYPYPMEVWRLGDQTILAMGGEVVVEYAIKLKQVFGQDLFVMGYSNDVMAYIPSTTILREGGYEGATSQMVYGLPAPWRADTQSIILYNMIKLAEKAGAPISGSKLTGN